MKKNRILLGTWQLGGDFGIIPYNIAKEILTTALDSGICNFDTSIAYGRGSVEEILGQILPNDAFLLTKIPASVKPDIEQGLLQKSYPLGLVTRSAFESLSRLRRTTIHTLMLHNWSRNWTVVNQPVDELIMLKKRGLVECIGISLPDGFNSRLSEEICKVIDVIEAPYNHVDFWVSDDIEWYQSFGIEVVLRSLFVQGLRLKSPKARFLLGKDDIRKQKSLNIPFDPKSSIEGIFTEVLSLNTSIVFGATRSAHIIKNISFLNFKTQNNENKAST